MQLAVCPHCANILTVSVQPDTAKNRLECRTCPYEYAITAPLFSRQEFTRKEKEDVFGGPGAWDNAQKSKVQCPATGCDGDEAAFFQVQIRSADEPMTSFFKVCMGRVSLDQLFIPSRSFSYDLRSLTVGVG